MEETDTSQALAYEVKHKDQSKSESMRETRASRPYPNRVDNMNAAKKQQKKRSKNEA